MGPRTYVNFARIIGTFFNWCKEQKYFPKDVEPLEGIDLEFDDEGEITIFTPSEAAKLLEHAEPEFVPFLAIGAFAGLRRAEIERLTWNEIKATHIEVTASKAKSGQRQLFLPAATKKNESRRCHYCSYGLGKRDAFSDPEC